MVATKARRDNRMQTSGATGSKEEVIEIEYPWYGFLVPKKALRAQMESDIETVFNNYQASQNQQTKFKAGKALADTVK